jgi:acyl dehydratase
MLDGDQNFGGIDFKIGSALGPSQWVEVTQELIDGFGKYTIDPDPFHIDPAWAKQNSPYGGTIAFGFFTMSMLTHLLHSAQGFNARDTAADPRTHGHYLNYGFNRLRLVTPVRVGGRIRGTFTVKDIIVDEKSRNVVTFAATIEIEHETRPALVADWLAVWVPADMNK